MTSQSPKETTDYYKHLSLFWTDIMHLMASKPQALTSIGPMRAFTSNSKKISTELIEINELLREFNQYYSAYYKQLAETWSIAQKKVNQKSQKVPHDVEQIESVKRVWLDIFDNDFTELFDSGRFGENYGKLVTKELELTKHWNNITNVILQSVNLPSKEEIDEVYKEIHSLKKRVTKLELELKKKGKVKNAN
ncbi:MAG TPA: poly(R)-hydroxyalkanoic acid synthase subunit PhaE [Nitrosopumilus sp.]|nr:poly(R)-hydroxyalkanoic acid synthase subunit PhaE [Nitrosopumilus sp.]HJL67248.1 poly(R)-hydroxyalkanoic acid synthase subunit PhaE [Nitrosopumilus sp.]HJM26317.1 poly(R)-hydroxyalkanoic acid synthase subunit PhaE [Nitrosopumilus sp.]HJO31956.1 poly(R)-hydroxyalkanoic acid synthase subunit PhaE [Nitrosopumilus sp.]